MKNNRNIFYETLYGNDYLIIKSKGFNVESFIYPYFEALNIQLKEMQTCPMDEYYVCLKKYLRENLSKQKLNEKILFVYLGNFNEEVFKLPNSRIADDLKREHLKQFLDNEKDHNCFNNFLIDKYREEFNFLESVKNYIVLHSKNKNIHKNNINFNFYVSYYSKKEIQYIPFSYYHDSIIYCKVDLATSKYGNQEIIPIDHEIIEVALTLSIENKNKNVHYLIFSEVTSDTKYSLFKHKKGVVKLYRVTYEKPNILLINKKYKISTKKNMQIILEKEVILNNNTQRVRDYIDTFYEVMNKIIKNNINLELIGKTFLVQLKKK